MLGSCYAMQERCVLGSCNAMQEGCVLGSCYAMQDACSGVAMPCRMCVGELLCNAGYVLGSCYAMKDVCWGVAVLYRSEVCWKLLCWGWTGELPTSRAFVRGTRAGRYSN